MRKSLSILLVSIIILAVLGSGLSGIDASTARSSPLLFPAGQSLTADDMEVFLNNYLGTQMKDHHVAGATVVIVKDGQVLFSKGYGYADVADKTPVDPEKTVFILGSLSKIFTWTAVMQLVEQGKLDLNEDVNTYLDFKIPDTFPQPITLNNLMAHNAGFEDRKFEQMKPTSGQVTPLGEWLRTHIPARVRVPGEFSAYSNYGSTLAGYIVERISGMSYDEYVEAYILSPLGMTHTSSRQPIPPALKADMSQSYRFAHGEYESISDLDVIANVAPAGAFRSTTSDMARFMIAHLNNGQYGDASILLPDTVQLMHSQSFTHDPRVNGMAHGFWEMDMNGQHIIGHAGSHFIFNSLLMLFPDQNLGVFVATNSLGGMEFIGGEKFTVFQEAFVDQFFPQDLPAISPPSDFAQHAGQFSGSYALTMGRSETTPEKLFAMLMAWDIKADKNGLHIPALDNARFVEVEPLVFRQVDDDTLLVFHEDSSGNITEAFLSEYATSALIKNRWFETPTFNLILLGLCMILFLSFLIVRLGAFFVHRRRATPQPVSSLNRAAQVVAGLVSVLSLGVFAGVFASLMLNPYGLFVGKLPLWTFVSIFSIVVVLLAPGMLALTVVVWVRRFWGRAGRIHYTMTTLGTFGFVWFMYFWNILGRHF